MRTRSGGRWTTRRIRRMLTDAWYYGEVVQHGERRPGVHECLVSRELFERVQTQLRRMEPVAVQARKGGRRVPSHICCVA